LFLNESLVDLVGEFHAIFVCVKNHIVKVDWIKPSLHQNNADE